MIRDSDGYFFDSEDFNFIRHFYVLTDLVEKQLTSENEILTDIYFNQIDSKTSQAHIKNPRYVQIKEGVYNGFFLEFVKKLDQDIMIQGSIISTLHFRRKNGL